MGKVLAVAERHSKGRSGEEGKGKEMRQLTQEEAIAFHGAERWRQGAGVRVARKRETVAKASLASSASKAPSFAPDKNLGAGGTKCKESVDGCSELK
jgi:hypothetical protein